MSIIPNNNDNNNDNNNKKSNDNNNKDDKEIFETTSITDATNVESINTPLTVRYNFVFNFNSRKRYQYQYSLNEGSEETFNDNMFLKPNEQDKHDCVKPPNNIFIGICFICQATGHSKNFCPMRLCTICNLYGHSEIKCKLNNEHIEKNNFKQYAIENMQKNNNNWIDHQYDSRNNGSGNVNSNNNYSSFNRTRSKSDYYSKPIPINTSNTNNHESKYASPNYYSYHDNNVNNNKNNAKRNFQDSFFDKFSSSI